MEKFTVYLLLDFDNKQIQNVGISNQLLTLCFSYQSIICVLHHKAEGSDVIWGTLAKLFSNEILSFNICQDLIMDMEKETSVILIGKTNFILNPPVNIRKVKAIKDA